MTYSSLKPEAPWPALLTQQLDHWHSLTTITSAEVILEHQRNNARSFRVKVRLGVPGPGLRTEASDSTLEGALLMATRDLEHQIETRRSKPLDSAKTTRQSRGVSGSGTGREA